MVVGVPDGDPAAAVRVAFGGEVDGVDQAAGNRVPLGVGQVPVAGVGADRAVPDVFGRCRGAGLLDAQVQRGGEAGERDLRIGVGAGVAAGVGGEAVPAPDEVRVDVLVAFAGAVQVDEQAVGPGAASDLGDHQSRFFTRVSAVSSMRARSRVRFVRAWSSSPGRGCPPVLWT